MNLWPVEHFFEQQQTHWGVGQQQTHPKVMTNMLKKVFNWSEVHLSEVTSYKIHTLNVDFWANQKLKQIWINIKIKMPHLDGIFATHIFNEIYVESDHMIWNKAKKKRYYIILE